MAEARISKKKDIDSFVKGELKFMGPGDPNGKPGTRGYQDGE